MRGAHMRVAQPAVLERKRALLVRTRVRAKQRLPMCRRHVSLPLHPVCAPGTALEARHGRVGSVGGMGGHVHRVVPREVVLLCEGFAAARALEGALASVCANCVTSE